MASIGANCIPNDRRNDGIHQADPVMQFLEVCDIALRPSLLTNDGQEEIQKQMRRACLLLKGFPSDNLFSQGQLLCAERSAPPQIHKT